MPGAPEDSQAEMLAHYRQRQSRLYRLLRAPLPLVHNPKEKFLPPAEGIGLRVGGAFSPSWAGFVTIDLEAYPGVDVAADVQALPFRDNSIAAIECDAVLEHVKNPVRAVAEMVRVLKPGGYIHAVVPFNQPFHAYPSDFHRWTIVGFEELLTSARCEVVASGIRTGPTATMLAYFCEYCRILAPRMPWQGRLRGCQLDCMAAALPRCVAEPKAKRVHPGELHLRTRKKT
jgi:SAM-dependent methyltransferase